MVPALTGRLYRGADRFDVEYENASIDWGIALDGKGRVVTFGTLRKQSSPK